MFGCTTSLASLVGIEFVVYAPDEALLDSVDEEYCCTFVELSDILEVIVEFGIVEDKGLVPNE